MNDFKGVEQDPERMLEYKERLRLSLVLEEYYKLKAKYQLTDLQATGLKVLEA